MGVSNPRNPCWAVASVPVFNATFLDKQCKSKGTGVSNFKEVGHICTTIMQTVVTFDCTKILAVLYNFWNVPVQAKPTAELKYLGWQLYQFYTIMYLWFFLLILALWFSLCFLLGLYSEMKTILHILEALYSPCCLSKF